MAGEKYEWLDRVKEVEREHTAVRFAADYLLLAVQEGQVELEHNLKQRNIIQSSERLQGTYIIRLFSEFELALELFLRSKEIKIPHTAKPLINRVAARIGFSGDILTNAHRVRMYRNQLVHNRDEAEQQMTIRQATSYLCTFLGRSSENW